jgi:hypothetical protein
LGLGWLREHLRLDVILHSDDVEVGGDEVIVDQVNTLVLLAPRLVGVRVRVRVRVMVRVPWSSLRRASLG